MRHGLIIDSLSCQSMSALSRRHSTGAVDAWDFPPEVKDEDAIRLHQYSQAVQRALAIRKPLQIDDRKTRFPSGRKYWRIMGQVSVASTSNPSSTNCARRSALVCHREASKTISAWRGLSAGDPWLVRGDPSRLRLLP